VTSVGLGPEKQVSSAPRTSLLHWPGKWTLVLGSLLVFATLVLYHPVIHYPFANADDDSYISDNVHVKYGLDWETAKWSFTTFRDANWHPLTWLSHALDCHLYFLDAGKHHRTNVLLHACNVVLVFWVLLCATGCTAAAQWLLPYLRCIPSTSNPWSGLPNARTC
jgi:hypothetical protein